MRTLLHTHSVAAAAEVRVRPPVSRRHWIWSTLWQISSVGKQREMSRSNKPMGGGRESAALGGKLALLLIAVCPIPPAGRESLSPSFCDLIIPCSLLSTAGMNHPLSPSSALLPVVSLVSHLSLLQRLFKVHQDLLLHKSSPAMNVDALAPSAPTVFVSRDSRWK